MFFEFYTAGRLNLERSHVDGFILLTFDDLLMVQFIFDYVLIQYP